MSFRISKPKQFVSLSFASTSKVWETIANSLNGVINAVIVDNSNNVYVGGNFTQINGVAANYIAKWDGANWSSLGTGLNAMCFALVVDSNNNLYAGGFFGEAGLTTAIAVARWNGTSWSALAGGVPGPVFSLAIDASNNIYAGGQSIHRWNGTNWTNLAPGGIIGTIYTIYKDPSASGTMFVGGIFSNINGVPMQNLARYNFLTSTWTRMGGASGGTSGGPFVFVDGIVLSMSNTTLNILSIGGFFTSVTDTFGTKTANYICQYDMTLDSLNPIIKNSFNGTNYGVFSITQDLSKSYFVVGGSFTQFCDVSALSISQISNTPPFAINNLNFTGPDIDTNGLSIDNNNDIIYRGGNSTVSRYINRSRFSTIFLPLVSKFRKI